jgi:hypothetical protein
MILILVLVGWLGWGLITFGAIFFSTSNAVGVGLLGEQGNDTLNNLGLIFGAPIVIVVYLILRRRRR